ncbi:hypothetical protein DCO58_01370 [Helicobacter saguini]|uniref:Uncharacterized protein n=1 Tax=Helicobacter saguini TaxID=1548018 RepID=A0A347VRB4_9HELI|nr:hypothetical protein [Helicobacter saguini]MWV62965.1 hypothetical protein [Helicobacter saguini]MWV66365.1 hypothetical protein [Helicobacter saguini]MWV68718.1 hypothetical protein [Helicobacter saguini]MWV71731.1 hypothetical protein [Helicobacter saguini]TLD92174.1 hypothetical protein LS64_010820 [Helicobacter saguini]
MWKKLIGIIGAAISAYLLKKYFDSKKNQDFSNMSASEKSEVEKYFDSLKVGINLIIYGNNGVGKTALISRLQGSSVDRTHTPTSEITKTLIYAGGLGGYPFGYPFGSKGGGWGGTSGVITMPPPSRYAIEIPQKDKEIIDEILQSSSTLCYVFNASAYNFSSIALDLGYLANLAKAKGANFRVLGTFGNSIDVAKKDSILQEIKASLESIFEKDECEIYADSPLPCGGGLGGWVEKPKENTESKENIESKETNSPSLAEGAGGWVNSTSNNQENTESSNQDSKDSNTKENRAPFPKNKNTKCKIAIFELLESSYNKDETTNAKLLKGKLQDFLDFGPPLPRSPFPIFVG